MAAVGSELGMAALRRRLEEVAEPGRVQPMEAYMRNQFPFLGITSKDRKVASRPALVESKAATTDELMAFASACWHEPEREFAYVACDVLRKHAKRVGPEQLNDVRALITTKSWWDTIDPLAVRVVGPMVQAHPGLVAEMDRWVRDGNFWVARTAILHQLMFKEATDPGRLFAYAQTRAGDTEFFIRKAIGWSLRQYARIDPGAVRQFVSLHERELSGLTKREAVKHLS